MYIGSTTHLLEEVISSILFSNDLRPSGAIASRSILTEVQIEGQKLDDKELVESDIVTDIVTDIVIPDTDISIDEAKKVFQ
jgi:hypothetical protein